MPEHDTANSNSADFGMEQTGSKAPAEKPNNIRLLFKINHSVLTPAHVVRPAVYHTAPWRTQTAAGGDCRKAEQNRIGAATQRTVSSGNWADSLAILMAKNNTQIS